MFFSPLRSTESRGRKNIRPVVDRGSLSLRSGEFGRGNAQLLGSGILSRKKLVKQRLLTKQNQNSAILNERF
jgi:hypothetical protein